MKGPTHQQVAQYVENIEKIIAATEHNLGLVKRQLKHVKRANQDLGLEWLKLRYPKAKR